jgi:hypothetical protein
VVSGVADDGSSGSGGESDGFMGHYVLVTGLDDERGGFVVNDPARNDERTFVHADSLEAARVSPGTDQDMILINVYQSPPKPPPKDSPPKIVRVCGTVDLSDS